MISFPVYINMKGLNKNFGIWLKHILLFLIYRQDFKYFWAVLRQFKKFSFFYYINVIVPIFGGILEEAKEEE